MACGSCGRARRIRQIGSSGKTMRSDAERWRRAKSGTVRRSAGILPPAQPVKK